MGRAPGARQWPRAGAAAIDLARLFGDWAAEQMEATARRAVAGIEQGDALQVQLAVLRRLRRRTPANTVSLGRRIGLRVIESSGYSVVYAVG